MTKVNFTRAHKILRSDPTRTLTIGCCILGSLLVGSCRSAASPSLETVFPLAGITEDWTPSGEVQSYNPKTLFNYIDGQAEFFFDYGFEKMAMQSYQNSAELTLGIEVWQFKTPADAYGIYAGNANNNTIKVGRANDGALEPERRLIFWQNRYFVHIRALKPLPDADLRAFAEAISQALPSGGERPELLDQLPAGQTTGTHALFFHEEMSIQTELWLGGENILGLSEKTNGVLARYTLSGHEVHLLLIQYPNEKDASTGLDALKDKPAEGLVVADCRGKLLSAVFGEATQTAASALLTEGLDGQ